MLSVPVSQRKPSVGAAGAEEDKLPPVLFRLAEVPGSSAYYPGVSLVSQWACRYRVRAEKKPPRIRSHIDSFVLAFLPELKLKSTELSFDMVY